MPCCPTPETNLLEVVGILKSYGVVLDAYSNNLIYIANHQFLGAVPLLQVLQRRSDPAQAAAFLVARPHQL